MSDKKRKMSFLTKIKNVFLGPEEASEETPQVEETGSDVSSPIVADIKFEYTAAHESKVDDFSKPMAVKKVVGYEDPHQPVVTPPVAPKETAPVSENQEDLDILFAENFTSAGGKFVYCEEKKELADIIRGLKLEFGWKNVYYWEDEVKELFEGYEDLKIGIGCVLENAQAAISTCESIVAADGSIVLASKQASTRALSVFPNTHVIIADSSRLQPNLNIAVKKFNKLHSSELPFAIYLSDKFSADSRPSSTLLLNAHGTLNIILIYVDEQIYHS